MPARRFVRSFAILTAGLAGALGGCATTGTPPTQRLPASQPVVRLDMDPVEIHVTRRGGVETYEVTDAKELFDRATDELDAHQFDAAIADYAAVVAHFPESRLALAARYNGGLACEGKGDPASAVPLFQAVIAADPQGGTGLDAMYRLGGVYAELRRFQDSSGEFAAILARRDLGIDDRMEAYARQGYAQLEAGDLDGAERTLKAGIDYYDSVSDVEHLASDFYLAMDRFYYARVPHARFLAQPVRLPQKQLEKDMDDKSTLLLAAQSRYVACIDVGNVQWAAAAGYEVGQLYKQFYDAVVAAPIPSELPPDILPYYKSEVRKKLAAVLEKAIRVDQKVVEVANQHAVESDWVRASEAQLGRLEHLLAETQNGDEPADAPGVGGVPASGPARVAGPASAPGPDMAAVPDDSVIPPPVPQPQNQQYVPHLPDL